jgi:hypothetical protein|tara:strand:+ start:1178 stop:1423 length:246 start_codon:yes stop_codon:yes gene_type:complete
MFEEAGAWFWTHVVAALLIIWGDSNGTLEPAVDRFEEMLGIQTELPPEEEETPYPFEEEPIDSTWILPSYPSDTLRTDNNE